ncbi:hypothetical protein BLOT_012204 [Blomia tropicalis]|nr:hypothetical protein BLOT_012204 [Blomia tropicalis]
MPKKCLSDNVSSRRQIPTETMIVCRQPNKLQLNRPKSTQQYVMVCYVAINNILLAQHPLNTNIWDLCNILKRLSKH